MSFQCFDVAARYFEEIEIHPPPPVPLSKEIATSGIKILMTELAMICV